ncbi:cell wall-binding repeat-containing protein [Haloimpatiens sp. FM7315]|uniref:cell wall-binding repeat-containing protein n=1 Tax=Haloimpatiens sp. FM7315 TaxID=3298609 RepID=UPI00370CE261
MKKIIKVLMTFLLMSFLFSNTALAIDYTRIGGKDRYSTSVEISKKGWSQSNSVILATGEGFADALCATPLGAKLDSPILLNPKGTLNEEVKNEIIRLKTNKVVIIGGTGAISKNVEASITALGVSTERIEGKDRYDTSYKIAKKLGNSREVIVATGNNFPDSLSIATVAGKKQIPILLSSKDELYKPSLEYIKISNAKAYIIGGSYVVGSKVYDSLDSAERIYGNDRYDTNIKIINRFSELFSGSKNICIANGQDYPDALAGSALAVKESSPIVLMDKTPYDTTKNYLRNLSEKDIKFIVFGGEGALPNTSIVKAFNESIYTITSEKTFEVKYVIKVLNNNSYAIDTVNLTKAIGDLSNSPYQYDEKFSIKKGNMNIYSSGSEKDAVATIKNLLPSQASEFEITRTFKQGKLKYDTDISKTTGNYSEFKDYNKYTKSDDKIESDNSLIVNKAREIVGSETNPYLKAKKIYSFVNTYMNYDYSEGNKGALNALKTSKGVCEDYSDLMVALCRASGVPARIVTGFWVKELPSGSAYNSLEGENHAWVEFYLPEYGWIVAEPTVMYYYNGTKTVNLEYFGKLNSIGHFIEGYNASKFAYSISANSSKGEPRVDVKYDVYIRQLD